MSDGMSARAGVLLLVVVLTANGCTQEKPKDDAAPRGESEPTTQQQGDSVSKTCRDIELLARRIRRGYVPFRSPDLMFIPSEPNYVGLAIRPVHSGPWDYLAQVPLVIYGPGHISRSEEISEPATLADLAPTIAALIDFDAFPSRDGRILKEALLPDRRRPPRLVVTVVWDGGGLNVLEAHENSWRFLSRLMNMGTSYTNATIGSSPSVTPPVHTTIGTGAFPASTGIPGLTARVPGPLYTDPLLGLDPSAIRVPTLADLYDGRRDNRAVVGMLATANWHLGMIGHGAAHPGGDRDPAILFDSSGRVYTNRELYSLPQIGDPSRLDAYMRALDTNDGALDREWRGLSLDDPEIRPATPAAVRYEEDLLENLIETEGFGSDRIPDLLYVNFKSSDGAGHKWGMTSTEVGDVLSTQDHALRRLTSFLDDAVGRKRWVLIVTADHGQTPYPQESGAWPIAGGELKADANERFDRENPEAELIDRVVSPGAYIRKDELKASEATLEDIAIWMAQYSVADNIRSGDQVPDWYRGGPSDRVFDAVMVGRRLHAGICVDRPRHGG
jgi:hypothetical protein